MKNFIFTIPQQPANSLKETKYENPCRNPILECPKATRFPILVPMRNTVAKGEKICITAIRPEPQTAARYRLLDELRGLDLISMMLYHGMWDVVFLFGVAQKWYTGRPGFVWQQSICWVFILLSGFCLPLGHHPFRRGAVVFGAGALVTAVTLLFLPEDVVWFGVLTLLGSSMLLTAALDPLLRRVPPAVGVAVSALLFWVTYPTMNGFWNLPGGRLALPQALYASYTTAYLGFMPKSFFSTDYFPLLPWLFLFWAGYFLHHLVGRGRLAPLRRSVCPPLGWLGRHSLVLYLLHQPVILGVLTVAFRLVRAHAG